MPTNCPPDTPADFHRCLCLAPSMNGAMPAPFCPPPSPPAHRRLALLLVVAAHVFLVFAAGRLDAPLAESPEVVMEATLLTAEALSPASPTPRKPATVSPPHSASPRPSQPVSSPTLATVATTAPSASESHVSNASTSPAPTAAPTYSAAIFDAAYLKNPAPPYPAQARRLGEEGRVVLRVQVSPQGLAEQLEVQTSSGSPRLDGAAIATVRQWKFVAARRGDQPVSSWVSVPVLFRLE